ncbi:AI-2E family transporter [Tessaracoccus caeni]|uniref:AI-2E family transporter n=1 Tax=Tessaracoccus caeni TaxID=3031239 RepID=UPI0023DACB94|nr:AI-2E family transporter [Tessaracoccus caeni]MDF1489213.1 AI-2E family transporter [Tessaracoccus caeni]
MINDEQPVQTPHENPVEGPSQAARPAGFSLSDEELAALPLPDPEHPVDKSDVIGEAWRWGAAWAARFLLIAAAAWVIGWALSSVSGAAIPILLSILLTSVLWPLVKLLKRVGIPYGFGALIAVLTGVSVVAFLLSLVLPALAGEWYALNRSALAGLRRLQNWAAGEPLNISSVQINEAMQQVSVWLRTKVGDIATTVISLGGSLGSIVATSIITLMVTFFMLKDGHRFVGWTRQIVGRRAGFHVAELSARIWETISGYVRTQAVVSLLDATFIGLGIALMGVPMAFPIAVLTFMAGFVPIVGAIAAGTIAILVALVFNGAWIALAVLVLVLAVQQIEGNVLQPVLQSRVMKLHPVVVLLSVFLGSAWVGILGAFLAVPVAATFAAVLRYLGDLVDLRAGERTAEDIRWVTEEGRVVGGRSEESAVVFKKLVLGRRREREDKGESGDEHKLSLNPFRWR